MVQIYDLYLRPATAEDIRLIYEWANDKDTRNNPFNIEYIKFENTREWFYKKLNDPDCHFYIFMQGCHPLGQIRIDIDNANGYVDYRLAPEYRAQGYDKIIFNECDKFVTKEHLPIKEMVVNVKPDNIALQLELEEAGFECVGLNVYSKKVELKRKQIAFNKCRNKILLLTNNRNAIPVYDWFKLRGNHVSVYSGPLNSTMIKKICPDWVISYNYWYIIPPDIVALLDNKIINMHISLLPWNRGEGPNLWSFLENSPKGVTIHKLTAGLDKGDILLQKEFMFDEYTETLKTTYDFLNNAIKNLLFENWDKIVAGDVVCVKQKGKGSYHTKKETNEVMHRLNISYDEPIAGIKKRYNELK